MIAKIVLLFLVFIAVLGMFGRLRFPSLPRPQRRLRSAFCPHCGRPMIGKGPCECRKDAR